MTEATSLTKVTIHIAGDSGDGIQLTGAQFTGTTALQGNDLSTFPDFPAEIRAPIGTVAGVSGFQINFGSEEIHTPGDRPDVLVVMNAAAFVKNFRNLRKGGIIIANESGFDKRNLRLAHMPEDKNPLDKINPSEYQLYRIDITGLNREALSDLSLGTRDKDRSRNMFVLGFLYWIYHRNMDVTLNFLTTKFQSDPLVLEANIRALKAGYHYGETLEAAQRYTIKKAKLPSGHYRYVVGNQAMGIGLITAARKAGLNLFYAGYPITPASDILHFLARHKNYGVKTFQAEDEIAAVTAALGASFAGHIGVTATSGPGMALKAETLGLAVMVELPLLIINVQRGGPSTGLPTKTEQADLLQAIFGRNGEAPIPVLAAATPSDCFEAAIEAMRIAIQHMTPVILLSDGFIANSAEPWKYPEALDIEAISVPRELGAGQYFPYKRDGNGVRPWVVAGEKGREHRIGGLEKEDVSGNVSYDPGNHQKMVNIRHQKIQNVSHSYSRLSLHQGEENGQLLILGWGSTFGFIKSAVKDAREEGLKVSQLHLRHLYPFHPDLQKYISSFDKILIPEMNNGQLSKLIKQEYHTEVLEMHKVEGLPFRAEEILEKIREILV